MRLTITPTEEVTTLDGQAVRLWSGKTEGGARCFVLVAMIAVPEEEDTAEFDRRLCGRPITRPIEPDQLPELARNWEPPA
jgi:hypothetical protein